MIPATLAPQPVPLPTATAAAPPGAAPASAAEASMFEAVLRGAANQSLAVDPAAFGARVLDKLSGFRARAEDARSLVNADARSGPQSAKASATPAGQTTAVAEPGGDMRAVMRLVVQTFDFATETHLVAKAATQMTGSMNTLLRGQ